ncbi:Nucleobase-ascorbate transporter 12 [Hordeum vulgare]|nr:Nucleobase-ascorbate transporter 12 [Hordeum vulgare]
MRKSLFLRIVEVVEAHNDYFKLTTDCCGQLSFSTKEKCTAPMRMLALGIAADAVGEMVRMGESTCVKTIAKFAHAEMEVFGAEYPREPNTQDTEKLLAIEEARGFPGMLGSIKCMDWQ